MPSVFLPVWRPPDSVSPFAAAQSEAESGSRKANNHRQGRKDQPMRKDVEKIRAGSFDVLPEGI